MIRTALQILLLLAMSWMLVHKLGAIGMFLNDVLITAGRSTRRLIALGMLLLFLYGILRLADHLFLRLLLVALMVAGAFLSGIDCWCLLRPQTTGKRLILNSTRRRSWMGLRVAFG
jgi:hypothetical protein